nr:MAG TPA: hypothetical protein [Caudoviricetes sp.]
MLFPYIIIIIALATPIPRYVMRPVTSNTNFLIVITSFIRIISCFWNIYTNFRKNFSNSLDYWLPIVYYISIINNKKGVKKDEKKFNERSS